MSNGKLAAALQRVQRTASAGGISDRELLQRFTCGGDEAAFELLLWRHQRLVFGVCRRVLHNMHDAEDAFQATFLVLARKGRSIGRGESLAAWLYRVAYRCALTVRARRARREQALVPDRDAVAPDNATQPAERHELRDILDEELSRLPAHFRAPAVLCYLSGMTVDEAAEQIGCPRGTVASRLARARERLRVRLLQRGVVLPAAAATLVLAEDTACAAPDALIRAVMTQVELHAMGQAATGTAVSVANKVVRAMFLRRLLIGSTVLALGASVLLVGGSLAMQALAQLPKVQPAPDAGAPAPATQAAPRGGPGTGGQGAALPAQQYVGRLEASQVIKAHARISGVVAKVAVRLGDAVKRGDLLYEIDAKAEQAALDQARANLAVAEAKCRIAIVNLQRIRELFAKQVVARDEVEQKSADADAAKASVQAARAAVEQAKATVDYTRITSPIDGHVTALNVVVGDASGKDKSTAFVTIMRVNPMVLNFKMAEASYIRYERLKRAGKIAGLDLHVGIPAADEKGYPHQAKFEGFAATVDADTGTIAVQGTMANPEGQYLPGMSVLVQVKFVPGKR